MAINRGLLFGAGVLVGAVGALVLNSDRVRPALTGAVRGVLAAREAVLDRVETIKEDMEDLVAEAKHGRAGKPQQDERANVGEPKADLAEGKA